MIQEHLGQKFFVQDRLYTELQKFTTKAMKRKDNNKIFLVCGDTGVGKSAFAFQCASVIDPKFDLKNITFTPDEMKEALRTLHNQVIIFDEAFRGASGRNTLSKAQKELLEMLYEIRQLNQVVFLVAPSFFRLDEAIAVELADALFYVHKTKKGRRGWRLFNKKKMVDLYYKAKKVRKSYAIIPTMVNGTFPKSYVVNEEEYRTKKFESLFKSPDKDKTNKDKDGKPELKELSREQIKNMLDINLKLSKPYTLSQLAHLFNTKERQLYRIKHEITDFKENVAVND